MNKLNNTIASRVNNIAYSQQTCMYMNAIYSAKQACKVDMQARIQCSCKSNSCTLRNTQCSRLCKDELAAGTGAPLKAKQRRSLWAALASWVVARANGTGVAILA